MIYAYVAVQTGADASEAVALRLGGVDGVKTSQRCAGPYDVVATVATANGDSFSRMLAEISSTTSGTARTVTCTVIPGAGFFHIPQGLEVPPIQSFLLIQAEPDRISAVVAELQRVPDVVSLELTNGVYDLIGRVETQSPRELNVVLARARNAGGVTRLVECSIVDCAARLPAGTEMGASLT